MSWLSSSLSSSKKKKRQSDEKITLRGAVNLLFYTFPFYDIFLLYLHCLYLSFCSNKIKLKDFVEYVCEIDHFEATSNGAFDVSSATMFRRIMLNVFSLV